MAAASAIENNMDRRIVRMATDHSRAAASTALILTPPRGVQVCAGISQREGAQCGVRHRSVRARAQFSANDLRKTRRRFLKKSSLRRPEKLPDMGRRASGI